MQGDMMACLIAPIEHAHDNFIATSHLLFLGNNYYFKLILLLRRYISEQACPPCTILFLELPCRRHTKKRKSIQSWIGGRAFAAAT